MFDREKLISAISKTHHVNTDLNAVRGYYIGVSDCMIRVTKACDAIQAQCDAPLILKSHFADVSRNMSYLLCIYAEALIKVNPDIQTKLLSFYGSELYNDVIYKLGHITSAGPVRKLYTKHSNVINQVGNDCDKALLNGVLEYVVMAEAMKDLHAQLKAKIGRPEKKSSGVNKPLPAYTCGWCLGRYEIHANEKMCDHGFKVGDGFRDGICPGVHYRHLDVSEDGSLAFMYAVDKKIEDIEEQLKNLPNETKLPNPRYHSGSKTTPKYILKHEVTEAYWKVLVHIATENMKSNIARHEWMKESRKEYLESRKLRK